MARLKVFVTSDGLTDYVVAASSRPKALAAWGVNQDLFKQGRAKETDDPALREAAIASPGEVLQRPTGAEAKVARLKPAKRPRPKEPSKAAAARVAALETKLAALDEAERCAEAKLEADRRRLGEQAAAGQAKRRVQREQAQTALKAARRAAR